MAIPWRPHSIGGKGGFDPRGMESSLSPSAARLLKQSTMTQTSLIHPVILCGGSGTRLWPASRKACPKPFLPLTDERTLFQQALDRVADPDTFAEPIVVAGKQHVDLIEGQSGAGANINLIVEPAARNTAPAIGLAAALLDPDAIMLVCPSDHHIADADAFRSAAKAGAALARQGYLVALGIAPTGPETGYGYIKRGDELEGGFAIERFVEKPNLERAKEYLASGSYSWNGGIFVMRAGQVLEELESHRERISQALRRSVEMGRQVGSQFHPDAEAFSSIEGDSIDYAVMENTGSAAMVPVDMGWSDIGTWSALQDALAGADRSNTAPNNADLVDCKNVLVVSDGPRVSAVGLEDICIIVDGDEVLVTTRDGAQKVGKLPGAQDQ